MKRASRDVLRPRSDDSHMKVLSSASLVGVTAIIAYFVAVALYGGVDALARLPHPDFFDQDWVVPIRSILLAMVVCLMLSPALRGDGDAIVRRVCVTSALALAVYSALKASGLADPDLPLPWIAQHVVEPLRALAGSS